MPSGMVAVHRNDLGSAVDETRSSQWIQSLSSQLIPKWNPRLGRGAAHDAWEFGLSRAVKRARLGHILGFAPPTLKEFKALYAKGSASTDANASYSDACKEHVDGNTMLYDLIVPSITLDASARSYKTDIKDIESLVETTENGVLIADGNGLLRWARSCIDVSGVSAQAALHKELALAKLAEGSSVTQLEEHLESYWRKWQLLNGNDPAVTDDFWARLLATMPTKPDLAPLTQVRMRLANRIVDARGLQVEPWPMIEDLVKYAEAIGIPVGKSAGKDPLPPLGEISLVALVAAADKAQNNCSFCECFGCAGLDFASKLKEKFDPLKHCLCHKDCKVSLNKVGSNGPRHYARVARLYHAAHPKVTTLKGVVFKTWYDQYLKDKKENEKQQAESEKNKKPSGGLNFLGHSDLLPPVADEIDDLEALRAFLHSADLDGAGINMITSADADASHDGSDDLPSASADSFHVDQRQLLEEVRTAARRDAEREAALHQQQVENERLRQELAAIHERRAPALLTHPPPSAAGIDPALAAAARASASPSLSLSPLQQMRASTTPFTGSDASALELRLASIRDVDFHFPPSLKECGDGGDFLEVRKACWKHRLRASMSSATICTANDGLATRYGLPSCAQSLACVR